MEKTPFRPRTEPETVVPVRAPWQDAASDWQSGLPTLSAGNVTLRELSAADAPSLMALLSTEEVARFIVPPPATIEGFERLVAWSHRKRSEGTFVCFAIVPDGIDAAVGIIQVRQLDPGFGTAEWGFAIGSPFWGSGIFPQAASLVIDFAFDTLGVHRLEARACVANGRGNGALRKLGAVQEGVLRRSLLRNGEYLDQILWTILAEDWRQSRKGFVVQVH
jgi:ribosomal-protein-alanine N-acetyltransferase